MMRRRTLLLGACAVPLALSTRAIAQSNRPLSIVTSLPKELSEAYKVAFAKRHPDIVIDIQQRGTQAAVTFLRETAGNNAADIFWASAPDAFEMLKDEKLLSPFTPKAEGIAEKIGDYPINDPDHYYFGFALSGAAAMWNTRYVEVNGLPAFKEWDDLARPVMHDHVGMAMPSRSGSTHLIVETILQARGWENGWALLRSICGNMRMITERSFGVPDAVTSGQFGYGIVFDYQALAARGAGYPVDFAYPGDTTIVPSNIGVVSNGPNQALARQFIEFMLSEEGQKILFEPTIGRLPVRPDSYSEAPAGTINPFDIKWGENGGFKFDVHVSEARYPVVDAYFDQTITFQLETLKKVTKSLHEADALVESKKGDEAVRGLVAEARRLVGAVAVNGDQAQSAEITGAFKGSTETSKTARQAELEQQWAEDARKNYEKAEAILQDVTSKLN